MTEFFITVSPQSLSLKFARIEDDCLFASLISLRLSLLQLSSMRANFGESDRGEETTVTRIYEVVSTRQIEKERKITRR